MIGEGNSDQVDYAREEIVWVVWGSGSHTCFNGEALSKACIHKENELKTRPMKPEQYIYRRVRSY